MLYLNLFQIDDIIERYTYTITYFITLLTLLLTNISMKYPKLSTNVITRIIGNNYASHDLVGK